MRARRAATSSCPGRRRRARRPCSTRCSPRARPGERIVTVEETFELDLAARDIVGACSAASRASRDGRDHACGASSRRRCACAPTGSSSARCARRRALDLLIALNSGLPGMCSIHANTARDALAKLSTLPLLAGRNIDSAFVVPTVAACIDIVVHCEIDRARRSPGDRDPRASADPSRGASSRRVRCSSCATACSHATGTHPAQTREVPRGRSRPVDRAGRERRVISAQAVAVACVAGAGVLLVLSPWLWPRSDDRPRRSDSAANGCAPASRSPVSAACHRPRSCSSRCSSVSRPLG